MIMRRIELARGKSLAKDVLTRSGGVDAETLSVAARIVDDVRARGDEALRDYTRQFDKADLGDLCVTRAEIEAAVEGVDRKSVV